MSEDEVAPDPCRTCVGHGPAAHAEATKRAKAAKVSGLRDITHHLQFCFDYDGTTRPEEDSPRSSDALVRRRAGGS